MSAGHLARQRSSSSSSRPQIRTTTPSTPFRPDAEFEPCAATASIFLYAQGSSIICLDHDTLAINRRFELHKERILFLSVDNVSERGAGRLVVSFDAGQTAIVWDLFSGDEVARFASYEPIRVAAWMKNGNIAFAIAPAADCQTYAIGYLNGSILLVSLRPAFTILHTLPVPRAPSPIVDLAWHASSTKQKSDMLAIQTADGDLRVWSVAKPPTAESPKIIRVLRRTETSESGLNWIAWSKNGRIIQYAEGETWSWDVRTKHVSCEPVPTVQGVKGLANYGPTGVLFTLGPNYTVQQYDMNPPAMTQNVQYFPMGPPPVPAKIPTNSSQSSVHSIPGTAPPITDPYGSETPRGPVNLSTIQRSAGQIQAIEHAQQARSDVSSPVSSRSMTESMSSRSSTNPYQYQRTQASYSSRAASGTTFSTISPSMLGRESFFSGGSSIFPQTNSMASTGHRSRGSRLRQEVLLSPESKYVDLFPRTRARLSTVQYKPPRTLDQENTNADELRRQMLDVVFGWEDDIEPLIRDELAHHQPASTSAVLLAKWLGEVDTDQMASIISSGNVNSSDWMMLALSSMGGQSGKMGQAFVQRLLQQGDFHTSATILLGMGDREDAVEVYVSRSFFMEAILLTCLIFPTDWQRQAHLVRRWGEFVVENSQQQLAIRCFQCTGVDPPMPWASPSLRGQSTPSQASQSVVSMLSPPISPPPQINKPSAPSRMTTKNSSLKLITSFGPPDKAQFKFPGLKSDDRTPTQAPGVTPIAESAISPGGTPGGFLRPNSRNKTFNRAMTPGGHRNRLPSIGETPVEGSTPSFPRPSKLPTPNDSGSDVEKERFVGTHPQEGKFERKDEPEPLLLLSSARYEPSSAVSGKSPMTALPNRSIENVLLPDPAADAFTAFREREASKKRSASKDRKPDGLHIRMPSNQTQGAFGSPAGTGSGGSGSGSHRFQARTDLQANDSISERLSEARSPPLSSQSWSSVKSPSVSGRSTDQFISSLDAAGHYSRRSKDPSARRHKSREGREHKSRSKHRNKDRSQDRGRNNQKYIRPAKRSPSSPVPMTPDDLQQYTATPSAESMDGQLSEVRTPDVESRHGRDQSQHSQAVSKLRSGSKASEYSSRTVRHISPDGYLDSRMGSEASCASSKVNSRQVSPNGFLDPNRRGRSKSKGDGSMARSPSSPLPLADQAKFYQRSEDEDDRLRLVDANRRQRLRSAHRSSSRRPNERGTSARRDPSPDRRKHKSSRHRPSDNEAPREPQSAIEPRMTTDEMFAAGADRYRESFERLQRKEVAAKELEARRESLLRRPEVPEIPHPTDLYSPRPPFNVRSHTDLTNSPTSWGGNPGMLQQQQQPQRLTPTIFNPRETNNGAASVGPYGLPATPKAMRHPRYHSKDDNGIPEVPEMPDTLAPLNGTFATGQPMMELPRSMSAPIPYQQPPPPPTTLPAHPAFHKALRAGSKHSTLLPLGEIGQHRRRPSIDAHPPVLSIDEALSAADSTVQITTIEQPPLLPELQHLNRDNSMAVPPPPPPPPAFPSVVLHHHSASSGTGSGLGVINIAIDEQPDDHVIEVPPPLDSRTRSPQPVTTKSPAPSVVRTGSGHRRGRSDQFKNGIKGFTERLRSTSRGRNNAKSPLNEQTNNTPSPYESVPPLYF
ncbi:MAG: hypothetical protein LQ346_007297 [Caloplaca aetnensis]|nr:MAG: hypothetical protein LQ346_007297 [Caloplaca aetnensis]